MYPVPSTQYPPDFPNQQTNDPENAAPISSPGKKSPNRPRVMGREERGFRPLPRGCYILIEGEKERGNSNPLGTEECLRSLGSRSKLAVSRGPRSACTLS